MAVTASAATAESGHYGNCFSSGFCSCCLLPLSRPMFLLVLLMQMPPAVQRRICAAAGSKQLKVTALCGGAMAKICAEAMQQGQKKYRGRHFYRSARICDRTRRGCHSGPTPLDDGVRADLQLKSALQSAPLPLRHCSYNNSNAAKSIPAPVSNVPLATDLGRLFYRLNA